MKVLFTGGGSGGHILPNLALIEAIGSKRPAISDSGNENLSTANRQPPTAVLYVGLKGGMEEGLTRARNVPFAGIRAGKLRRYFDWRNFTDMFKSVVGFFQSLGIVARFNPDVVFAKGGFVSVPVVTAAWILRKKIITHESDVVAGLANRFVARFADTVCLTFPKEKYAKKEVVTGLPLRREIIEAATRGETSQKTFFPHSDTKTLFVFGGSLGADEINRMVWDNLDELLEHWNVIHITGKSSSKSNVQRMSSTPIGGPKSAMENGRGEYLQFAYAHDILRFYQEADVVLCRAGATAIVECIALSKPMILMPLGKNASRGEQLENAKWVWEHGEEVDGLPSLGKVDRRSSEHSEEWRRDGRGSAPASLISDPETIKRCIEATARVVGVFGGGRALEKDDSSQET